MMSITIRAFGKKLAEKFGISKYWILCTNNELRLLGCRLIGQLKRQSVRIACLCDSQDLKLNFGCGNTVYPGWVGVDGFCGKHVDLVLDLRLRLPFPDCSVDYCHSEHFLEHLYPDEGLAHLKEVCRILKPGGIYRVVVPDVIKFARKYIDNDVEFFRKAFPWANRPMEALYAVANWAGQHRNLLDYDELLYMGEMTGFSRIELSSCNQSSNPILNIDIEDPQREAESLYVELVK